MTVEQQGYRKGLLVASLFFILLLGAMVYYVNTKYVEPLEKKLNYKFF